MRDWIYIDDVVDAYICVLNNIKIMESGYHSFEVGTGEMTSLRDFVISAKEITNSKTKLCFGETAIKNGELMRSCADVTELCGMGWKPQYNIEKGIQKILREIQNGSF